MTAEQAKMHLTRQDGEPTTGYVSAWDVGNSVDQIYTDMDLIVPPDAGTLDSLTDVEAANPTAGEVLAWSGTSWQPAPPAVAGDPFQVPEASGGDDTTMIQQALDAAEDVIGSTRAAALVRLWPGQTYTVSDTLVLPSQVILDGQGSIVRLADASNCDVFESKDFATLTGSNLWFADSEGVPSGFGLIDLVIDGNKAGQTDGVADAALRRRRGISIYGKHYYIRNVVIDNCRGTGFYSECAYYAAAQVSWLDVPEATIDRLRTQFNGGHGIHFRGPHDACFTSCFPNGNDLDGYISEVNPADRGTPGGYNGSADIAMMHSHGNGGVGVRIGALSSVRECSSENNAKEGLIVNAYEDVRIHGLMLYMNWKPDDPEHPPALGHGYASMVVNGGMHTFGNVRITTRWGGTGLRVDGDRGNTFGVVSVDGRGTGGRGISIAGNNCRIGAASIRNFNGDGGVGLQLAAGLENVSVDAIIDNCDTYLNLPGDGTGDQIRLNVNGTVKAGQVGMTGSLQAGRGNELDRHLGGSGTGLFHDSIKVHLTADRQLANDGTWYYVTVPIPGWISSVEASRVVVTAAVGDNADTDLPIGQQLHVRSIDANANTAKILWTHPFGAAPDGASVGDTVTVSYTVDYLDQG